MGVGECVNGVVRSGAGAAREVDAVAFMGAGAGAVGVGGVSRTVRVGALGDCPRRESRMASHVSGTSAWAGVLGAT